MCCEILINQIQVGFIKSKVNLKRFKVGSFNSFLNTCIEIVDHLL